MEFKFRGKTVYDDGDDFVSKWVYGSYYKGAQFRDDPIEHSIITNGCIERVGEETVSQFTGLYDDNGNEIYGMDIVEVQNTFETKTPYLSLVYFGHDGAIVNSHPSHIAIFKRNEGRLLSSYCDYGIGDKYDVSCKIIGNLHDNPELVTE